MLQILKRDPKPERDVGLVNYVSPDQVFATAVAFLRRQYPVVLIALLATLTLGATYLLVTRSTYTAQATLIIDTRKLQPFQSQNALFSEVPVDSPAVESQLEIIKSDNIARAVIRDLHLANDPEFARYGGGLIGNALFYLYAIFEPGDNSEEEIERRALREFSNNMNAKRIGLTYVIEIFFYHLTLFPQRAQTPQVEFHRPAWLVQEQDHGQIVARQTSGRCHPLHCTANLHGAMNPLP